MKYAGSEPRVGIHLRRTADGRAVVRISDNGRGIPGRFRRQIFRRFERLGLELERERPGTGLGLYIVRNIARRLKARIRVRDGEAGTGTVFEVQMPGAIERKEEEPAALQGRRNDLKSRIGWHALTIGHQVLMVGRAVPAGSGVEPCATRPDHDHG